MFHVCICLLLVDVAVWFVHNFIYFYLQNTIKEIYMGNIYIQCFSLTNTYFCNKVF